MTEIECYHFCNKCEETTLFMYGGSGKKGICENCGNKLPPEEHCDMKEVRNQNVVELDEEDEEEETDDDDDDDFNVAYADRM